MRFTYSLKRVREVRKFHVSIVQRRLINFKKSVIHVQSCCFANTKKVLVIKILNTFLSFSRQKRQPEIRLLFAERPGLYFGVEIEKLHK